MQMGSGSDGDDLNDPSFSKTTTSKRRRSTASAETCQQTLTISSQPSSSNSHIAHMPPLPTLPSELIGEILKWLPLKFLSQLRCVCKSWKSLISDPLFAKKHLRSSPTVTRLIISFSNPTRHFVLRTYPLSNFFDDVAVSSTELKYPFRRRKCFDFLVGSCHGILCFAVAQLFTILWNPSIGKFKKLPPLGNQRCRGSFTVYGFGYDCFTDSYKVVAIFCYECHGGYKSQVKVLTLGTDSWRSIQEFPSVVPFDEPGKFVSGTVNWLAFRDASPCVIVSLDLQKESYEEVLQPDFGEENVVTLTLCVLRDCLCVLSHGITFFYVWLMKDYGNKESWTKLFRVPYPRLSQPSWYVNALCISEDDQLLLEFESRLVVYDSRRGTFKKTEDINYCVTPEIYIESLISPCF